MIRIAQLALLLAAAGVAGCTALDRHPSHPVRSEAEAIEIAKRMLKDVPVGPNPRYEATNDGTVWVVIPRPQPAGGPGYAVMIDPETGKASVGAYQTATIDEKL
ncbi:hypothetical protein [Phenylobacterium sp.]|uniref:hypothetical protein n=1 Tax=Phenylobacterium sp. TaxID=1871053 RepID=UPI002FCBE97B